MFGGCAARGIISMPTISLDTISAPDVTPSERQSGYNENKQKGPNSIGGSHMQEIMARSAGIPSLEADFHDYDPAPPPRRQSGAVAKG